MAVNKTSLSVGEIIYDVLTNDAEVMARANKVFPVVTDKATLPYVAYRRSRLEHNPAKGTQGADTVQIDVLCFAAKYGDGVQLAEAVRQAYKVQNCLEALGAGKVKLTYMKKNGEIREAVGTLCKGISAAYDNYEYKEQPGEATSVQYEYFLYWDLGVEGYRTFKASRLIEFKTL